MTGPRFSAGRRRGGLQVLWALAVALLAVVVVPPALAGLSLPGSSGVPSTPSWSAGGVAPSRPPAGSGLAAIRPATTSSYDWDPMTFIGPAGVPAPLPGGEGAGMVTDDNRTTVLEFGGISPLGLTNLTITGNETTGLWSNVTGPVAPSARANFSFAADPALGLAVLFGGLTNLGTHHVTNDTWAYYFANRTWVNVTTPVAPPRRESAAFAVDPAAGVGLLQGGWNPSVSVGGSTGSVTWNDTWELNLTTFQWSQLANTSAPPPLEGSGMIFDPVVHLFLLFGGCGQFCSNRVWSFALVSSTWRPMLLLGDTAPAPREGAVVLWEGQAQAMFVFGGDAPTSGGLYEFNDTYLITPNSAYVAVNSVVVGPASPPVRFGAPAAYLGANGCPGVFLLGGSETLLSPPTDAWFIDDAPDVTLGCNVWGGDSIDTGGGGGGGGGSCAPATNLTVAVLDRYSNLSLGNASVTLGGGKCGSVTAVTDPRGFANFTNLSLRVYTVVVTRGGYHDNNSLVNLTGGGPQLFVMYLTPLPTLLVRTFARELGVPVQPLGNVGILLDTALAPIGETDSAGWLNITGVSAVGTTLTVRAVKPEFSNASVTLNLPYTGKMWANLTLSAYGEFRVHVASATTGRPIPNATGFITSSAPGRSPSSFPYSVDPQGTFQIALPEGNYSVTARAYGFVPNGTPGPVFHPWVNLTQVYLNLTPLYGANLSVRLLDRATGLGIPGGNVSLGGRLNQTTNSAGWAFFVDVLPAGEYAVLGSAIGYISNSTSVYLGLLGHPPPILLNLTPIPGCPSTAQCVVTGTGPGGASEFTLLPSGGATLALLVALPFVLLGAAVLYALNRRKNPATGNPPGTTRTL